MWYHQVARFHPAGEQEHGRSNREQLAKTLDKNLSANNVWKARQFSGTYSRPEIRELAKPTKSGYVLPWSHMVPLLSLEAEDRAKIQADCLASEWSSRELQRQIKALREPKGKGGRKYEKPADLKSALRQLIEASRGWIRRYDEV